MSLARVGGPSMEHKPTVQPPGCWEPGVQDGLQYTSLSHNRTEQDRTTLCAKGHTTPHHTTLHTTLHYTPHHTTLHHTTHHTTHHIPNHTTHHTTPHYTTPHHTPHHTTPHYTTLHHTTHHPHHTTPHHTTLHCPIQRVLIQSRTGMVHACIFCVKSPSVVMHACAHMCVCMRTVNVH